MAYVRATLSIEGVTDPLPPPVSINAPVSFRLAFTDGAGAAVAASDAALEISRPDGVEFEAVAAAMTSGGVGVWTYTAILDQGSQWRFRATGAGAASADLPVTVVGSALSPPLPTGPILADETGLPLVLPEGGLLTMIRVDRLAEAADPAGMNLVAVLDGQTRRITWETLEAAAATAGLNAALSPDSIAAIAALVAALIGGGTATPGTLDFSKPANSGYLLLL